MKTKIHINQHKIKSNKKNNVDDPVITIKTYKSNKYAKEIRIHGESRLVYSPDNPLKCGAKCWIETDSVVEIIR